MARIPNIDDVVKLDRDEWEDLCNTICNVLFQTHRVEDRLGKGNGLDAWRRVAEGIQGWQFRRLNARLGDSQISTLKDNIELAAKRTKAEHQASLVKFCVVINIDPEPGHLGSKGEIERLNELAIWALAQHGVTFEFKGVSWVRTCLLQNPWMRPTLFEDVAGALESTRAAIHGLEAKIAQIEIDPSLRKELAAKLEVLLREATTHFERGHTLGAQEDYHRAIVSWEDALRLVRGHGAAPAFEGKILAVLAGVQALIGQIQQSITNSRKARELLNPVLNAEDYWWATGNLAFGLTQHQEYDEAAALFVDVLRFYESQGNLYEIARTVQLAIELDVQRGSSEGVLEKVDRLVDLQAHLIKTTGPTELTIGFLGTMGNALNLSAHQLEETTEHVPSSLAGAIVERARTLRGRALVHFRELETLAAEVCRERLNVMARGQQGYTLWHMDQLAEAEQILTKLIGEGHVTFGKAMADAQFNRALILEERGRTDEARDAMDDARTRYLNCGDINSAQDAKVHLERFARESSSRA